MQKDRKLWRSSRLTTSNKRLVGARTIDLGQRQLLERKVLQLQSQQRSAVGMQETALCSRPSLHWLQGERLWVSERRQFACSWQRFGN